MNRNLILLSILLFTCFSGKAQDWKRTAIWYFGQNAGLDFNTNPPTPLTNGQINTIEGCATISDTAGNLVMYTDGQTVWNKNHQVMVNGTGLLGDASSTQAVLIVPVPDNDSLYYVFTTDAVGGSDGFTYSVVNIYSQFGKGEVAQKNIKLLTPVTEKLSAVKHQNQQDYWVVTHEMGSNRFYSYLLTTKGLIKCPVISSSGTVHGGLNQNAIGSFKFSPDGHKAALCLFVYGVVELFDFDPLTGKFSNPITISGLYTPSSVEFSNESNYLYISERDNNLIQYKIHENKDSVFASRYIIHGPVYDALYTLQLGLNNIVYSALRDSSFLPVINYPNQPGPSADFQFSGQSLTQKSLYGLPNFVSSYFHRPSINFAYSLDCSLNSISLTENDTIGATDFTWKIIRESSGIEESSSTDKNPAFQFQDTGWYTIKLIASNGSLSDSVSKTIHIKPNYVLNLGNDTTLCVGQTLLLDAGSGQHCYVWRDSSMGTSLIADTAGTYWVKVTTNNFCTCYDSISVSYTPYPSKPQIARSNDTLYTDTAYSYQWYRNGLVLNGAIDPYYHFSSNGWYQVEVRNEYGCETLSDTFSVTNVSIGSGIQEEQAFRLFPNPSKGQLFIEPKDNHDLVYDVQILSASGIEIFHLENRVGKSEINTYSLSPGLYVFQIITKENIHLYKIIIH